MSAPSSLLFVHAHPDDEALFSAGTTRRYVTHGVSTFLVTCTDGRLGLDHRVRAGNDPRHNSALTRQVRSQELSTSVELLGFERHVTLGYRDSGLSDWRQNLDPGSFVNADVEAVARTIASIIDEVNAAVVVTYDENGYYGHPDHIQCNVVTQRAVRLSSSAQRLFYPVTPRSVLKEFVPAAQSRGVSLPLWVIDAGDGLADEQVTVDIDATEFASLKQQSIAAHASQVDNADLVTMDEDLFRLLFGHEYYQLGWSRQPNMTTAHELFGGLT